MKRKSLIGIGAAGAALAAFFLHPHKGPARRQAVRRGGEKLVLGGSRAVTLVGSSRRHGGGGAAELRSRLEDALYDQLGGEALSLRVVADRDTVTVRGEVGSLDQITRVSQAIERLRGDLEVDNLVRLRTPPIPGTAPG
jgi:osmotically-inducible protein OsmY